MNGHDRLRFLRHGSFDQSRIDVVRLRIDIHENRFGADSRYTAHGREECEWCCDDLVARTNLQAHQTVQERIGPARDTDAVPTATDLGNLLLQLLDLRTADTPLRLQHLGHTGQNLVLDRRVLGLQIQQWYLHYDFLDKQCLQFRFLIHPRTDLNVALHASIMADGRASGKPQVRNVFSSVANDLAEHGFKAPGQKMAVEFALCQGAGILAHGCAQRGIVCQFHQGIGQCFRAIGRQRPTTLVAFQRLAQPATDVDEDGLAGCQGIEHLVWRPRGLLSGPDDRQAYVATSHDPGDLLFRHQIAKHNVL